MAEAIAAAVCWLDRWNGGRSLANAIGDPRGDEQVGFWHRGGCRYCRFSLDELLAMSDLAKCDPDELRWWQTSPRRTRAARVREAQEVRWWEEES